MDIDRHFNSCPLWGLRMSHNTQNGVLVQELFQFLPHPNRVGRLILPLGIICNLLNFNSCPTAEAYSLS